MQATLSCSMQLTMTTMVGEKNKKKVMSVVIKLKSDNWRENVDEMYIGGHLINNFQSTHKKSANVAFSYFFQIYSVQNIKACDELLVNYNNCAKVNPK